MMRYLFAAACLAVALGCAPATARAAVTQPAPPVTASAFPIEPSGTAAMATSTPTASR
jgi:hypothetical protein